MFEILVVLAALANIASFILELYREHKHESRKDGVSSK